MTARTRSRATSPASNVVPLHAPVQTPDDIVREVQERSQREEREILDLLHRATASLQQRHRKRAQDCLPIGYAMAAGTLDDWIEIGQRMLGQGGRT